MVNHLACLLLLLACLTGFSASELEEGGTMDATSYGPSSVEISGVDIVTVGILYGFQCSANCYPGCQYSWTRGNVTSQGPELSLNLLHIMPTQTLACTVVNPETGNSVTVQKTLQVTAGPSNIQISGPPMLTIGAASTFTCSADCYPSCSYSWTIVLDDEKFSSTQGNTTSVTPPASTVTSETLICEAQNTVSQLFISTTLFLWVASLSNVVIAGDEVVVMGKQYTYICFATCVPSCVFTWKYMGKTFRGNRIQIPILEQSNKTKFASHLEIIFSDFSKTEPLTCEATNTLSHTTITTTKNLTVFDPISVRPTSRALPIAGKSFSLECVGSQNPGSITWLKNKGPMPESGTVHFSPDNITMTFSPLMQADEGLYQCVVAEGETPIQSVGYKMQVNYGPSSVIISGVNTVTVGILYSFQCSASCYPTCQFTWTWENVTSQGPNLSLQLEDLKSTQILTCTAVNPATGISVSDQKMLQITGLSNVIITGDNAVVMGEQYTYICSATCVPSCVFTWRYMGKTVHGDRIQIPILSQEDKAQFASPLEISFSDYSETEPLTCEVTNMVSNATISITMNLTVIDPFLVRPSSQALPVAGEPFSLECVGPQDPASITWLKNEHQMLASERVHFSLDNTSVTFSPLLQADKGEYQCLVLEGVNRTLYNTSVVAEGGTPILSVGYLMQVNYGPDEVRIVKPNKGPVGNDMFTPLGSTTELQCLTDCFPACSITWFYHDRLLTTNASIFFTPVTPPYEASLTCVALNWVTKKNLTAETTVVVPDGPKNMVISGPDSLEVGVTSSFTCSAECTPSCSFTWTVYGKTMTGSAIDITVNRYISKESISCQAENTFTRKMAMINETLSVFDPHWCGC